MPQPKPHRNVRVDDKTWWDAVWVAEHLDQRISDVVRDLLHGYVRRNRQVLRDNPRPEGWTSQTAQRAARRRHLLDEAEKREA